ncbi:MAG: hypothetical protein KBT13_11860 [Bacteroidales bacterium]|nr:hypothetical protein [Candidatus Sodaliphilus limicaballi]
MAKKINRDLFGNPLDENMNVPDNRPVLLLNAMSEDIKKCYVHLTSTHTKVTLEKLCEAIKNAFRGYVLRSKSNPSSPIPQLLKLYTAPRSKDDYTWPAAIILGNDDNFREFFKTFPQGIKRVWEQCYRQGYISDIKANKLAGEPVVSADSRYFYSRSHTISHNLLSVFNISSYYYHYFTGMSTYIWMPRYLWNIYNRAIADKETHPIDNLDNDGKMLFYSNEQNIGEQLFLLNQIKEQGEVEFGAYKMPATATKKIAKQLGLNEFFPCSNSKELKQMAAQVMIPSLAAHNFSQMGPNINQYWEIIAQCVHNVDVNYITMEWLSHLKAVKRDNLFYESKLSQAIDNITDALRLMTPGKWFSCDDFDKLRRSITDVTIDTIMVADSNFVADSRICLDDERLRVEEIYDNITVPVCKGLLMLFATYGLLEIAYYVPATAIEPRFNCLEYLRLTKLGEYVFGHTATYEAPGMHKPTEYFEVDPERLIIRALVIDGKNPYEPMLQNFAEPIGAQRYRVTADSFMANCKGIDDIMRKWEFFTHNVTTEPSAVWKSFYAGIENRCYPLLSPGKGYTVMKILPGNNDLLRILSTDKYIREHTIRAERNHILIETKALAKVKDKLREYGYLI